MAQILAHPFRVAGPAVVTVDSDSDDGRAQLVALLLTTRKGERQLRPGFGISDPVFSAYGISEINAGLAMYGPAVQVTSIVATPTSETTESVQISFQPQGSA